MNYKDCFANIRHQGAGHEKRTRSVKVQTPKRRVFHSGKKQTKEDLLEMRIRSLLEKYKDNPDVCEKIRSAVGSYQINVTVARSFKSADMEKKFYKKLQNTLNQF